MLLKESVLSLKVKQQHNIGVSYFQTARKYFNSFMTDQLNIIFDDFGI